MKQPTSRMRFVLLLAAALAMATSHASEHEAPASPEVTAAMQPYFESSKWAGAVAVIADKSGKVHNQNLLGSADVEAKKPVREDNVFWIASMSKMFAGGSIMMFPEAGGGLFSTMHDILRYGLMLANDGELEGKRYLSHAAMDKLRKEQTGTTKVNYSLGYHLRNGMFGHDGAYGTDLSVNPKTGMVAVFMIQCTSGDQWAARDLFLKTATELFQH
jgi:CubicO group peptidase (beta-lactamase class C family)